jgi:Toxin PAAR-like domain
MAVTIHVNGRSNSLVHKGSMCIAKSTIPDVCKTPSPGGPVPIPYPVIVSMSSDLKKGTKTVKVDGKKMAAIKGSEFSRCTGDEPGTAGGVKSSTNMKEATWLLYSFDVKLDGKNACRLSDKMMMNHGNTACMCGPTQEPKPKEEPPLCLHCGNPVDSEGHELPKMDDKKLMAEANAQTKPKTAKTVGGIKTGDTTAFANSASPAVGTIRNLKTKLPIPISPAQAAELGSKGNAVGNCCEQKLLNEVFINQGLPFPPPAGLKMGIAGSLHGKPTSKELKGSKHKKPCGTCDEVLAAMLCTNEAKE